MMNSTLGSQKNSRDDVAETESRRAKHQLQNDLLMLDGDLKKQRRLQETYVAEIRKTDVSVHRMEGELEEKKTALTGVEREIRMLEEEMKKMKRSLNAVK